MNKNITNTKGKIDWMITLVPLGIVIALCILFFLLPDQSNAVLSQIRFFFGDTFGTYYLVIGLGIFLLSLYIAGSKYGDIVLGEKGEKPKYSFFSWGAMMFTCGLAADILFYSFSEWVLYATDPHLEEMGSIQEWAGVYPLFHWSFIPWGFYLVLAVAFGFMLHVRKRNRQKYSEACRPILGKHTDGWAGRIIDLLAVFALLAGTAPLPGYPPLGHRPVSPPTVPWLHYRSLQDRLFSDCIPGRKQEVDLPSASPVGSYSRLSGTKLCKYQRCLCTIRQK